jgi:hypothetical protein
MGSAVSSSKNGRLRCVALLLCGLAVSFGLVALVARSRAARATLVVFSSHDAPLALLLEETLDAPAVRERLRASFSTRRVDARAEAALFRAWLGSAGLLGSVIIDQRAGAGPDVVAVLPGYADAEHYRALLDDVARQLPRLRELRDKSQPASAESLELAELYSAQGSLSRARSCLESIQAPLVERAKALEHLARLELQAGRVVQARFQLERARALAPPGRSERWLLTEALILSGERRVSEAAGSLRRGLPSLAPGPERTAGWRLLGKLTGELEHMKHPERAHEH